MKKFTYLILTFFFSSIILYGADRISRYDKFQGGTFTGDSATITTITGTTLNGGNLSLSGNSLISTDTNGNINFNPDGTGLTIFSDLTATTVPYLGASKEILSSSVTPTELGYLSGVTSAIQTQFSDHFSDTTTHGTTGNIVGTSDTQTLTNKTLDAPVIDNSIVFVEEASTPSNPSSGYKKLYPKTDGKLYTLDSSGTETEVGSGSGGASGLKNYFSDVNTNLNDNVTSDFSVYDDTGAYVDGTGGSPATLSISATNTASELLEGNYSLKITKAATDGSGEGISLLTATIDRQDYGKELWGTIEIDFTAANYTDGDFAIKAYDVTNSSILAVVGDDVDALPKRQTKIPFKVLLNSTTASVRLSLHLASDSATASTYDLIVDDFKLGPNVSIPSPIIADLGTETWSDSEANSTTSVELTRKGNTLYVVGTTSVTGAFSGSDFIITIPSQYAAKTSEGNNATGAARIFDTGTSTYEGLLTLPSTTTLRVAVVNSASTYGLVSLLSATVPHTWANTDSISFKASWVVDGWDTGSSISTTEKLFRSAVTYTNGATPTATLTSSLSKITFGTIDKDDLGLYSSGVWTAPTNGTIDVNAHIEMSYTAGSGITSMVRVVNTTTGKYVHGHYYHAGSDNQAYIDVHGSLEVSKGNTIEIQGSCDGTSPIIIASGRHSFSIAYRNDEIVFSGWGETEVIESASASLDSYATVTGASAGQYTYLTFIEVPPGEWDFDLTGVFNSNGATTTQNVAIGLDTTSGNTVGSMVEGDTLVFTTKTSTSGDRQSLSLTKRNVVVTETTNYYLKTFAGTSITNLYVGYKISARRIK